jgi:hypothetical protein
MPGGKRGRIGGNYPIWVRDLPRLQLWADGALSIRAGCVPGWLQPPRELLYRLPPAGIWLRRRCATAAAIYGLTRLPGWRSCFRLASNMGSGSFQ